MLMVIGFHHVFPNASNEWLLGQPASIAKFVYQFVYMGDSWLVTLFLHNFRLVFAGSRPSYEEDFEKSMAP